jgi:hypothetical protein
VSDTLRRLRERRQHLWAEAQALFDKAAAEDRTMRADEAELWEALSGEVGKLDEQIKTMTETTPRPREEDG